MLQLPKKGVADLCYNAMCECMCKRLSCYRNFAIIFCEDPTMLGNHLIVNGMVNQDLFELQKPRSVWLDLLFSSNFEKN